MTITQSKHSSFICAVSAIVLGSAGPALAQSSQSLMEEVIVTAQKRSQSVDDIGMAITAVSGDTLEQLGITDTADLARIVPGFTFADTGLSTPIYTIRGVGYTDSSVQAQSTVGVYNDQIAVPFPIMSSGLQLDVGRVEVLKGPQGTLYGRNSTGGAINYVANRPTEDFEGSIKADYGRFDTADLTGVVSGSLSQGVRARFSARTVQSGEGWQQSISRDDTLGKQDKLAARLLIDFDASDSLSFNLAANYWNDQSDTQAPQLMLSNSQRPGGALNAIYQTAEYPHIALFDTDNPRLADWTAPNSRLDRPKADTEYTSLSLTANWDINDNFKLTSLSSYSEFSNDSAYDYSGWGGIPLDLTVAGGFTARQTISPLVRGQYDDLEILGSVGFKNDADIEAFSQELRLSGTTGAATWLAGVYYSDDTVDSVTSQRTDFSSGTNLGLGGTGVQGIDNRSLQTGKTWAVFAHSEWELSDSLSLTTGLRYTEDKKDFSGCTADTGDGDLADLYNNLFRAPIYTEPGTCAMSDLTLTPRTDPFETELNQDSTSWRLGLDYDLGDDTLLYGSYSRGFKSGSFPTLTANLWESLLPVVQEQLDAYEVGIKTSLLDNSLKLNGSVFFYDYTDKQLKSKVVTIFGPADSLANVPESTVYGIEVDASWAPTDNLYLTVGATYLQTEVDNFQGYTQVGIEGDFSGSEFPLTPELQGFAMANYDFPISDNLGGFFNIDLSYSSESQNDYAVKAVLDSTDGNGNSVNGRRYPAILDTWGLEVGDRFDVAAPFKLPSAFLVGARLGVNSADGKWSASIWGRNLTNEYTRSLARKTSDSIVGWAGQPRTYGVSVGYSF